MELSRYPDGLPRRRWASAVCRCIVLGSLVVGLIQVAVVALKRDFYQYDFRSVYLAEQLLASHKNPYSWEELLALSGRLNFADNNHPFLYPPHALLFYAPLQWMGPALAYYLWLTLNIACCGGLFFMVVRHFRVQPVIAVPLLVFGLNSSLTACLRAGQLSLLTAACLTAAGLALARGRASKAMAVIWLGGIVKLQTIPLLGLLLLRRERRAAWLMGLGLGLVACVVVLEQLFAPTLWASFQEAARSLTPALSGPEDGSMLNVLRNLLHLLGVQADSLSIPITYGIVSSVVLALGVFTCRRLYRTSEEPLLSAFLIGLLTWELLLPRMMVYEWVILLPALCFHLSRITSPKLRVALLLLLLFPGIYVRRYALGFDTFLPAQSVGDALVSFGNWLACIAIVVATALQQTRPAASLVAKSHGDSSSMEPEMNPAPPPP